MQTGSRLLELLVESSVDGILAYDRDCRYTLWNPTMEKITGISRENVLGKSAFEVFPFLKETNEDRFFYEALNGKHTISKDRQYRVLQTGKVGYFDGNYSPIVDSDGKIVGGLCIIREITDRKKSEEALRQKTKFVHMLERMTEAANSLGSASVAMQRSLVEVCMASGWPLGHVYSKSGEKKLIPTETWFVKYPEKFRVFQRATMELTCTSGVDLPGQVFKSGKPLWIRDISSEKNFPRAAAAASVGIKSAFAFPILVGNEVVAVLEFFDINASEPDDAFMEVMAYSGTLLGRVWEKERCENAIRESGKNRASSTLEEFAHLASHDLKEPLRVVTSYLLLLQNKYEDRLDSEANEFISIATSAAQRMHELVNDLMSYAKVDFREPLVATFEATEVVQAALANLVVPSRAANADITMGTLPKISGDRLQLIQVFQCLVANAIKFCGTRRPAIRISAEQRTTGWVFAIRDNGIGIEPQHFERIFLLFQRLHPREQYPGSGMGLAVAKKIVERHGGSIWVESIPGTGTTFLFTLPQLAENPKGT